MALPELTGEQRGSALEKAVAVRRLRGELRRDLQDGKLTIEDVLEGDSHIAKRMRVFSLLTALPTIGPAKATDLMEQVGIAKSRRVGGLGVRQKRELLTHFGFTTKL